LIEAAFQWEFHGGWSNTPAIADVAAYLAEYPQCCAVSRGGRFDNSPILDAILLCRFYAVSVEYPVTDVSRNQSSGFYQSILIMDCCGVNVPDS
jgi:hypothetical protein